MIDLIHGRFEEIDIDRKFDLVIADPPDNLGKKYDGVSDKYPVKVYRELIKKWVVKCCEISHGPVFFIPNEKWTGEVEEAIKENKLNLIQRIVWTFTFGQFQRTKYAKCFRPIYWLNSKTIYPKDIRIPSARQEKYKDKRAKGHGKLPEDVWDFSRVCGTFKERRKWHQCQLPEALVERIVLGHSKTDDWICDPFIGSGTTAIICKRQKRNCVGIDFSKSYLAKIDEHIRSL